jgi:hypothetical protein
LENVVDMLVVSHFGQIQVQFVACISLYSSSETTAHRYVSVFCSCHIRWRGFVSNVVKAYSTG